MQNGQKGSTFLKQETKQNVTISILELIFLNLTK